MGLEGQADRAYDAGLAGTARGWSGQQDNQRNGTTNPSMIVPSYIPTCRTTTTTSIHTEEPRLLRRKRKKKKKNEKKQHNSTLHLYHGGLTLFYLPFFIVFFVYTASDVFAFLCVLTYKANSYYFIFYFVCFVFFVLGG